MTIIDPVMLELYWTRLISIVDEAAKVIVRTSFSTLSNEANDFSCVLTDELGNLVAQNASSIPSFICTLPATVRHFLAHIGTGDMRDGDVLITNNPWIGTGHLNDVTVVKPIFRGEGIVAFAATTSHMPDIGGRIRSVASRELFEEGFHIPPMHLMRTGVADETLVKLIRTNVRTPDQTIGDIWAQVGALHMMESRLLGMLDANGLSNIRDLADELFERSETAMRGAIQSVPDGTYSYRMSTDGLAEPFELKIAVTVRGDEIEANFEGSSPQQLRAINCPYTYTFAMTAYAVKAALLPNLANNQGMFRPITVKAPEGCILNPRFPASVGGRAATGHFVPSLVFGALHQVCPDRVMAGTSPLWNINLSGIGPDGKPFASILFFNGGTGARPTKDGVSCLSWPSNLASTPVEVAERNSPVFFHYKQLRPNSGGEGEFRGGLGQDVLIEITADPVSAAIVAERTKFAAPGLGGGEDGGLGAVKINGVVVDNRQDYILHRGDLVLLGLPGGGGYGLPDRRLQTQRDMDQRMEYTQATISPNGDTSKQPG